MLRKRKRLWALLLSAALLIGQLGATAYAEGPPNAGGLCEHHTEQIACTLTEGCTLVDGHEGKCVTEPENSGKETACALTEGCTLADGHEGLCVTEPKTDEKETTCTMTEGCTLPAGHEGECVTKQPPANSPLVKTVTGWTFMDDDLLTGNELSIPNVNVGHQADFDTVVSMLPTQISAEIDGETEPATLDITGWNCLEFAKDSDGNWPLTGEYTFTAKLQEGYVCEPLPTVKVLVGGAEFYGNLISGDGYTFNPNNGELTVTNSNGTVNWKNSQISKDAVETLILNDGVTAIANSAFMECVNLGGTIVIPTNMTSIGTNAFASTKITSLDLSNASKLETIDNGAFYNIETLSTVKIPRSVKSIGLNAFKKTPLTSVDLSEAENLTSIGNSAFRETKISSITIPPSVTIVDNFAFVGCAELTSVTFTRQSAPTLGLQVFDGTSQNLVIHVPDDAIGYDGANWPADKMVKSPTLTLTAAPEGSQTYPGSVTLTAALSGASGGNAGKIIQFTGSGSVTATTNEYGVATYIFTDLTPGTYNFGASFAGDTGNNPATAVSISGYTVSRGAQEALTLNGLASAYTYGGAAFALSTSGGSGNGTVSYTSSNGAVASVADSQVTILKAGTFTITATKAADDHYSEAKVTSNTVTVHPATPDMSLTATGGTNINDPIILTATVSKVGTGTMPTGTVIFSEGGTKLGTVSLDGSGKATCTVSNPDAGSHTYTAEYSGQSGYYNADSTTCTVGVGLADQTGFSITDPGAKTYGDGDFTLTATGGQSAGGVSFSVPSGNGVLTVAADGKVTITGAGKVTVTATKAGDSTYNQATATLEITVAPRDISHVTVNVTGSRVYTGSQLQPVFEVKDGALAVTTGDYTNNYGPNVDAGAGAGVITLTGQRNYTGTKMATFDIEKRPLTGAAITLAAGPYTHTGGEIKPAVTSVMVADHWQTALLLQRRWRHARGLEAGYRHG